MSIFPHLAVLGLAAALSSPIHQHQIDFKTTSPDGIQRINQLWLADITYLRLQMEFVYLAVVLDAFSRRCIGWALQRSLEAALVLEALRRALRQRRPRLVWYTIPIVVCNMLRSTTRHDWNNTAFALA